MMLEFLACLKESAGLTKGNEVDLYFNLPENYWCTIYRARLEVQQDMPTQCWCTTEGEEAGGLWKFSARLR